MPYNRNVNKSSQGFTLLELSIVLVIIGLLVGGVLVGQDLIKAASLRATVSQYEKYGASLNTFRLKFGGVPGDLLGGGAYGLDEFATPDIGMGDGDGYIQGDGDAATGPAFGETLMFWRHLSQANLIEGAYGSPGGVNAIDLDSGEVTGPVTTAAQVAGNFPAAKLGNGNYFIVYSEDASNYFQILGVTGITGTALTSAPQITPREAYDIDSKVDNGVPNSGRVTAMDGAAVNTPPSTGGSGAGDCVTVTDETGTYNLGTAGGDRRNCSLRLRFN